MEYRRRGVRQQQSGQVSAKESGAGKGRPRDGSFDISTSGSSLNRYRG